MDRDASKAASPPPSSDRKAQELPGLQTSRVASGNPCGAFQKVVEDYLVRHRSVLDVLSKSQESMARVNRAVVKAVTTCGCVQVEAAAQQYPPDASLQEVKQYMDTHLRGELCEHCRDVLDVELGQALFYLAAICNLFNIPLDSVIKGEIQRVTALGIYNLT